jgi:hypothetical protein
VGRSSLCVRARVYSLYRRGRRGARGRTSGAWGDRVFEQKTTSMKKNRPRSARGFDPRPRRWVGPRLDLEAISRKLEIARAEILSTQSWANVVFAHGVCAACWWARLCRSFGLFNEGLAAGTVERATAPLLVPCARVRDAWIEGAAPSAALCNATASSARSPTSLSVITAGHRRDMSAIHDRHALRVQVSGTPSLGWQIGASGRSEKHPNIAAEPGSALETVP